MLDANKREDLYEISLYGKSKGFLEARKKNLPTYSNFNIIKSEEDLKLFLDTYKEQNDFYMRSDVKLGETPVGVGGKIERLYLIILGR